MENEAELGSDHEYNDNVIKKITGENSDSDDHEFEDIEDLINNEDLVDEELGYQRIMDKIRRDHAKSDSLMLRKVIERAFNKKQKNVWTWTRKRR